MAFSEGLNTRTKYRWTLRWNKIRLPFSKTFCYPFASSFKCIFKHFYGGGTPIHKIDKSKCGLVWKQAGRPRTLLIGLPFPTFSFVFSGPWDNSVEPSILQNIICWSLHQSSLLILYMGKVNTWEETGPMGPRYTGYLARDNVVVETIGSRVRLSGFGFNSAT